MISYYPVDLGRRFRLLPSVILLPYVYNFAVFTSISGKMLKN